MLKLEDIKEGVLLKGIIPNQAVSVVAVTWHGDAVEIFYKRVDGRPDTEL